MGQLEESVNAFDGLLQAMTELDARPLSETQGVRRDRDADIANRYDSGWGGELLLVDWSDDPSEQAASAMAITHVMTSGACRLATARRTRPLWCFGSATTRDMKRSLLRERRYSTVKDQ
jgi:hypothetical protein